MRMSEIEFIEGIARCANELPATCTLEPTANPPLHLKFEWLVQQLRGIYPEEVRAQFPEMEQSMFRE